MGRLLGILHSTEKNFRHWITSPRIWVVWIIMLIFNWYSFRDYAVIAEYVGENVSLCVFPFFFQRNEAPILLAATAMLLYSEAPFTDRHAAFLVIRTGRRNWLVGQILYILLSSLLYVLGSYLTSILVMLPHVQIEFDWGKLLWTLAQNPELAAEIGSNNSCMPDTSLMGTLSGGTAVLYTLLIYWLVVAFLGTVMLCFNILLGKGGGTILTAMFLCFSLLAPRFGTVYSEAAHWIYGLFDGIIWFSPIAWCNILRLLNGAPPLWYAVAVLTGGIVVLGIIAMVKFCKKDLEFEKGEY